MSEKVFCDEKKDGGWQKLVGARNAYIWFAVTWQKSHYTKELQASKGLPFTWNECAMLTGAAWNAMGKEEKQVFTQYQADDVKRFKRDYRWRYGKSPTKGRYVDHCSKDCSLHDGCDICCPSSSQEDEQEQL